MRHAGIVSLLATVAATAVCSGQQQGPRDYILPSWGDIVYSYGPGVDPALDCPEAFEHMIAHWKGRGFRGVLLRTDLGQLDPATFRRNPLTKEQNPREAVALKYIDEVMDRFDVHAVGNAISEKNGFEFWAWHAHMFSDGAPENAGGPGPYRIWPWSYVVNYTFEHPEALTTDRTQKKHQWMVREYGYPEARASKIAEFVYMAKKFGLRRFEVENRSEASQVQDPPDNADRFGFNDIVVQDMRRKYGVDILTDPRFDVDSPSFNSQDPMVENWHKLRGDYFTQFFRELRKALNDVDPKIQIAASLAGDRIGPPMGNWFTDWRTWIDEGLIDAIVSPCDFDAYPTTQAILNTYITCAKQGRGTISRQVLHDYIKQSKHPEVKIISSGGSFFFPNPPVNGNSWRTTDWYDSYQMAWYQRWNQLMHDLDEFGCIKFLDQSFDTFPVNSSYYSGGYGNKGYVPNLRTCPGCWLTMGPANDTLPSVQSEIHYGGKGNAVKLTSDPKRSTELIGQHNGTFDRSLYYACIEPGILNGHAEFEYRIYRDSDDSSVIAYFHDSSDIQPDIAVKVDGGTGELRYSRAGTWSGGGIRVPIRSWQQIRISVDLDKHTYSAFLMADQPQPICTDVAFMIPKRRSVVSDDGSGASAQRSGFKMLTQVDFVPQGKAGSVTYLDDVMVRWAPIIPYEKPARSVLFGEDFEEFNTGDNGLADDKWERKAGNAKLVAIESQASYGEGVKSLRLQGTQELVCRPTQEIATAAKNKMVLDLDLFVRSADYYVTIMPGQGAQTKHQVTLELIDDRGTNVIALKNDAGRWSYLDNGQFKLTSIPVAQDCWNHIQFSVDRLHATYKLVLQPVGEMPAVLASGALPPADHLGFAIKTSNSDNEYEASRNGDIALVNFSCIDNVRMTGE